jgi:YHS domain-containing protein
MNLRLPRALARGCATRNFAARLRAIAAACAIGVFAFALAPLARAGLVVDARMTGLPGDPAPAHEKLLLGGGKLKLVDLRDGGRTLIVRLDAGVVRELDPKLQMYTETSFEYLQEQRKDAERKRDDARKVIVKKHDEKVIDDAEFERLLRERNVRADGKRIVTVARGSELLDGERVERVAVELNGVTQVAVWETTKYKDYKPPKELFEFYDKCGFLPDDVTDALRKNVTLFPARIYANIDYYKAGDVIDTRVESVSEWPETADAFEVPPSYKKVKEFPKEDAGQKVFLCPICGKPVDPATTPYPPERDKKTGEKFFFDSQEHWEEFLNRKR